MLLRFAPFLFVLLWSTGFVASKAVTAHAEPFTFLVVRFAAVIALLAPVALAAPRPTFVAARDAAITGMLIHAGYLGGVMWALSHGMSAGVVAIIVCLQPILTALLAAPFLDESITLRHWAGLAIGLLGVTLVVAPKLGIGATAITSAALISAVLALVSITLGTLFQKVRGQSGDLKVLVLWQYVGAFAVALPVALLTETMRIEWTREFIAALAWLVLVLSIGAIGLLLLLIRSSAVSRVTSLFYLVPAVTAVMAWALFGETLSAIQIAGLLLVMAAVLLTGALRRA